MPRKRDADVLPPERKSQRQWLLRGRSPRRLVVVGLVLTVLAAILGVSWLIQGIKGLQDLNGPHQQWHGVVVEHDQGSLLFTHIPLSYSLVVGFIDQHNPSATFTVNVDADTFAAVPNGRLITLDLGPQTGHVYALATSQDGVTWNHQALDANGDQLRLLSWLLVPSGVLLGLLGPLGLALIILGVIDFVGGTETISGMVVDVVEGSFFRMPSVIMDCGNGVWATLLLRPTVYEKVCEDGGRSQMTFIVSRRLRNVRRSRRKRGSSGVVMSAPEQRQRQSGDDWQRREEAPRREEQRSQPAGPRLQPAGQPPQPVVEWWQDGVWVAQPSDQPQDREIWRDGSRPRQNGQQPREDWERSGRSAQPPRQEGPEPRRSGQGTGQGGWEHPSGGQRRSDEWAEGRPAQPSRQDGWQEQLRPRPDRRGQEERPRQPGGSPRWEEEEEPSAGASWQQRWGETLRREERPPDKRSRRPSP